VFVLQVLLEPNLKNHICCGGEISELGSARVAGNELEFGTPIVEQKFIELPTLPTLPVKNPRLSTFFHPTTLDTTPRGRWWSLDQSFFVANNPLNISIPAKKM